MCHMQVTDRELAVIAARLTAGRDTPATQAMLADHARRLADPRDPFARMGSITDDEVF